MKAKSKETQRSIVISKGNVSAVTSLGTELLSVAAIMERRKPTRNIKAKPNKIFIVLASCV